jgi:hypothetical protein
MVQPQARAGADALRARRTYAREWQHFCQGITMLQTHNQWNAAAAASLTWPAAGSSSAPAQRRRSITRSVLRPGCSIGIGWAAPGAATPRLRRLAIRRRGMRPVSASTQSVGSRVPVGPAAISEAEREAHRDVYGDRGAAAGSRTRCDRRLK